MSYIQRTLFDPTLRRFISPLTYQSDHHCEVGKCQPLCCPLRPALFPRLSVLLPTTLTVES